MSLERKLSLFVDYFLLVSFSTEAIQNEFHPIPQVINTRLTVVLMETNGVLIIRSSGSLQSICVLANSTKPKSTNFKATRVWLIDRVTTDGLMETNQVSTDRFYSSVETWIVLCESDDRRCSKIQYAVFIIRETQ